MSLSRPDSSEIQAPSASFLSCCGRGGHQACLPGLGRAGWCYITCVHRHAHMCHPRDTLSFVLNMWMLCRQTCMCIVYAANLNLWVLHLWI